MKTIGQIHDCIAGIVFDVDNTLYPRSDGYLSSGSIGEIEEVSKIICLPPAETEALIARKGKEITDREKRKVALTETVYELGITESQWHDLRCRAWRPENWIQADSKICDLLFRLNRRYLIAFGTNSPVDIGRRVLNLIGITKILPDLPIYGPENLKASKPNPKFFVHICEHIGVAPASCVSVGDREFSDGPPAIQAGYSGALIADYHELIKVASGVFLRGQGKNELQGCGRSGKYDTQRKDV